MTHPFPYFGQGSGRGDELAPLIVFESEVPAAEMQRLAATAPPPFRHGIKSGGRWLWLSTSDQYLADARRCAREASLSNARNDEASYAAMSEALERWILEVHREHPVALFFVDSIQDDPHDLDAWHTWSIAHYAERVRPVVAQLRADGAIDHASWIVTNFLKFGSAPSIEDVRTMAAADGPTQVGNINRRCISIVQLMETLGDRVLTELGPYAELGYWAAAAVPERLEDPATFPQHLAKLARACTDKDPSVLQKLLVLAAMRVLDDTLPLIVRNELFRDREARPRRDLFPQALAIVELAANLAPLSSEQIAGMISTVRPLGADLELLLGSIAVLGAPLEPIEMAWSLRVRAIDPRFFAVALHLLAEAWATLATERDVRYCPKHVSIVGELPLDDSPASARTEDVLAWLKDPSDAYRAWPELPFPVKEGKKAKSPRFSLKVDAAGVVAVALDAWALPTMFDAHPRGGGTNRVANTVVGKTQLTVPWQTLSLPPQVARGPILNMARRFHFRVTKVSAVELALG